MISFFFQLTHQIPTRLPILTKHLTRMNNASMTSTNTLIQHGFSVYDSAYPPFYGNVEDCISIYHSYKTFHISTNARYIFLFLSNSYQPRVTEKDWCKRTSETRDISNMPIAQDTHAVYFSNNFTVKIHLISICSSILLLFIIDLSDIVLFCTIVFSILFFNRHLI